MKSALVHYWLTNRRGGEVVLEAIGALLPQADLYAHIIDATILFGSLQGRRNYETFIARLPLAKQAFRAYLPLMPLALEALNLSDYDLIVSSEAGPAKWVIPGPNARHVCYCHSPMRYIWDQRHIYSTRIPAPLRPFAQIYQSALRRSDIASATRVDQFVANSRFVANRIWKYYRREAEIVYPPVDLGLYAPIGSPEDYYLIAGQIVPYKRVELAVRACTKLGRRLRVIGTGRALKSLQREAGPTVEFQGWQSDLEFRKSLAACRALLFPGVEDFGLIPVETMASGRPVIAYGKGGAVETVAHGITGLLFDDQSVEGMIRAILDFEAGESAFDSKACLKQAAKFSRQNFKTEMTRILGI